MYVLDFTFAITRILDQLCGPTLRLALLKASDSPESHPPSAGPGLELRPTERLARRHDAGGCPTNSRKTFVKWEWVLKPLWRAMLATELWDWRRSHFARSTRLRSTNSCGRNPVETRNRRAKCIRLKPATRASSTRLIRLLKLASIYSSARFKRQASRPVDRGWRSWIKCTSKWNQTLSHESAEEYWIVVPIACTTYRLFEHCE